jgi:hypothetical protein
MQALGRPPVPIRFGTAHEGDERQAARLEISRKRGPLVRRHGHFPGMSLLSYLARNFCASLKRIYQRPCLDFCGRPHGFHATMLYIF